MLDTDISSCIMKRANEPLLQKLQTIPISEVCISVVTKAELLYGVEISPRQAQDQLALDAYLRHVVALEFPNEAAIHYAQIRGVLKTAGNMIGSNDLFIAAHARSTALTLVTNNTEHFECVPKLSIENWTLPAH